MEKRGHSKPGTDFIKRVSKLIVVGLSLWKVKWLTDNEPPTLESVLRLIADPLSPCAYAAFQAQGEFNITEHLKDRGGSSSETFSVSNAGTSPAFAQLSMS